MRPSSPHLALAEERERERSLHFFIIWIIGMLASRFLGMGGSVGDDEQKSNSS